MTAHATALFRSFPVLAWWPAALPLAIAAAVLLAHAASPNAWPLWMQKAPNENVALLLTCLACASLLWRHRTRGNPVHLWLAVLAAIFTLREIHVRMLDPVVYAALLAMLAWGWRWRERLLAGAAAGRLWLWVWCTGWTYLVSQLVARRVFIGTALEAAVHVPLEELTENCAHLMLAITAFADRFPDAKGRVGGARAGGC